MLRRARVVPGFGRPQKGILAEGAFGMAQQRLSRARCASMHLGLLQGGKHHGRG